MRYLNWHMITQGPPTDGSPYRLGSTPPKNPEDRKIPLRREGGVVSSGGSLDLTISPAPAPLRFDRRFVLGRLASGAAGRRQLSVETCHRAHLGCEEWQRKSKGSRMHPNKVKATGKGFQQTNQQRDNQTGRKRSPQSASKPQRAHLQPFR